MASSSITSWQIEGKTVEAVMDFLLLGSKTTVDGDCSHQIGRWLLLGRKAMTNINTVLKSRDITLLQRFVQLWEVDHKEGMCAWKITSVMCDSLWPYGPQLIQAPLSIGFSRQECWSGLPFPCPKEGTEPKNWCLQTVVVEKTPQRPLDCKEIKPLNLKGYQLWIRIGRTDADAEVPVFWSPDRNGWFCSFLMLGKIKDRRRRHQKLRWLDGITDAMDMNLRKLREMVRDREPWSSAVYRVTKSRTLPGN